LFTIFSSLSKSFSGNLLGEIIMFQLTRPPIKLIAATALTLATAISAAPLTWANPASTLTAQLNLPPVPQTGTPAGSPRPGTTRPQAGCPQKNAELTAIIANNKSDFTGLAYPSLWFYVPYSAEEINYMEFVLLDGKEQQTIYRTAVELKDESGLVNVKIPSTPEHALAENQNYHWYLMLGCDPNGADEPALIVDGWIQRPSTATKGKLWYDNIHQLAEAYIDNPDNPQIQQSWASLLEELAIDNQGSISQANYAPSSQLPAE
jgi:hypothetical protein